MLKLRTFLLVSLLLTPNTYLYADLQLKSCDLALIRCGELVKAQDTQIKDLTEQVEAQQEELKRSSSSGWDSWEVIIISVVVGGIVGYSIR